MSRKLIFLGVISLILAPGAALSLGLGEIRLDSYLNQPMNAEIALSISSADELEALRVRLAPTEAFQRAGIDRPAYLDDLRFQVRAAGPRNATIQVSSSRPITEPFVTFLIEARWSGGRALREYTVLLDPPVFMPGADVDAAPAPAAAAAPRVSRPAQEPDARPAPAPAARAAPSPAPATAAAPGRIRDEYEVRRNDTLYRIAQQVRPDTGITTNQVMMALFRENPRAFDGNINRLRAGAILRVPSRDQMLATSTGEANADVRRQAEAWQAGAAAAPAVARRLELAPPTEAAAPPAPVAAPTADPVTGAVRTPGVPMADQIDVVQELRSELSETRRLMEIKDAEIAALQARLAEVGSDTTPVAPVDAAPDAGAQTQEPQPVPAAATPAPAPAATAPAAPPAPEPTLLERAFALFGNLWLWLIVAAVLIAAAVMVFLRSRGDRDRSIEDDLAETGTWGRLDEHSGKLALATAGAGAGAGGAARRTVEPKPAPSDHRDSIVVEEARPGPRGVPQPAPAPAPQPKAESDDDYQYPFEDTIAGETGINLDQTDPVAEADFHMAYGLYDQAADIIRKAVEREPDRYDLRRKLIDICFVWGNAEEFLAQAKAIREMGGDDATGDWPKIAIMGRQICPGEPLFEAAAAGEVDLDFSSEETGDAVADADAGASEDWLDFDVGESEEPLQALGDTREQPAPALETGAPENTAEINLEELGMDLELGATGEYALQDLAERAPEFTEESVEVELEDDETFADDGTLRLPGAPSEPADTSRVEETASEDDGGTQMLESAQVRRMSESPTQRGEGWELAEDEPTVSGFGGYEEDAEVDQTLIKKVEPFHEAPTTEVAGFEDDDDAHLGLDELTQALKADVDFAADAEATRQTEGFEPEPEPEAEPEPAAEEAAEQQLGDTAEMPPAETNEVGTKLDLARAYIDMGDPEGARSILGEVVAEGDEGQKGEARQLLESLA